MPAGRLTTSTRRSGLEDDVERIVRLVRFAERCEDGWRQWFASTGIQPREATYEDLTRDRLTAVDLVRSAMSTASATTTEGILET
jgi:LPS sulfotransferase NodH